MLRWLKTVVLVEVLRTFFGFVGFFGFVVVNDCGMVNWNYMVERDFVVYNGLMMKRDLLVNSHVVLDNSHAMSEDRRRVDNFMENLFVRTLVVRILGVLVWLVVQFRVISLVI